MIATQTGWQYSELEKLTLSQIKYFFQEAIELLELKNEPK
mgnify:CR=1 FL=1